MGLAALLGALLVCAALGRSVGAQREQITTTLHPGWNMIGWIHEETSASALFEQLDSLESVYDGSGQSALRSAADSDSLTLQPGQGYWLRIDAEQPLEWARLAEPLTLRFQLEAGDQLVAWAGPSDRSIDDVLLGLRDQLSVAWRWIAAEQRFAPWSPSSDVPTVEMPAVDRGDAVLVNLTEGAEWLHPTGDLPRIEFPGGLHQDLPDNFRELVEGDLRFVVERFAAKFQFEVPAERLHLRVPTTPGAYERQQQSMGAVGYTGAWASDPLTVGGPSIIVMPWRSWDGKSCTDHPREVPHGCYTLAHEYFHIVQYALAGPEGRVVPGWLTEGTAMWSGHIIFQGQELNFGIPNTYTNELDLASRSDPSLFHHALGFAAVTMLVERAGPASIVQVWESLGQAAQEERHWMTGFARAFDVSYQEFLTEFRERRSLLFRTIRGQVRAADNQSLPSTHVWATSDSPNVWYSADVSSDGQFELTLLRLASETAEPIQYALTVGRKHSTCQLGLRPDGTPAFPVSVVGQSGFTVSPHGESTQPLDIQLPASFCRDRLALQLAGAYAANGVFSAQFCIAGTSACVRASGLSGGRFEAYAPLEADYWIRVADHSHVTDHVGPCIMYVGADGLSQDREQALRIASSENPGLIRVRLDSASDSCVSGSR